VGDLSLPVRSKAFGYLWSASVSSAIGTSAGVLCLTWLVFTQTDSALDVAALAITQIVPLAVFGVFGGPLVDRFSRTKIMLVGNGLRAVVMASLSAYQFEHGFAWWIVFPGSFVLGVGSALFRPALNAFLPQTMKVEQLGVANGLLQSGTQTAGVLGGPIAGFVIAGLGVDFAILLNGTTYALSTAFVLVAARSHRRGHPPRADSTPGPGFAREISEGFAYLRGAKGLLSLTLVSWATTPFLYMFSSFLVVYVSQVLSNGALVLGFLFAAVAVGVVSGGILAGRYQLQHAFGTYYTFSTLCAGMAIMGLVFFRTPTADYLVVFVYGLSVGFGTTTFFTCVQRIVPNRLLGRYLSMNIAGTYVMISAGQLCGGVVISIGGIVIDFAIAGIGAAVVSLGVLVSPAVRTLRAR